MEAGPRSDRLRVWPRRLAGIVLPTALLGWLVFWVRRFDPALINDEYVAIDFFYRSLRQGGLYPTPDRLYKPFSALLGVFAWWSDSPLGFELATAAAGAAMVVFIFLSLRREFGDRLALLISLAVALHPDLVYYSAIGSSVLTFSALAFAALLAAVRRDEDPRWLWVYSGCFFLAGLIRPEAWLFMGPVVVWWRPRPGDRADWARVLAAVFIIALAPLLWFGKDQLINHDFLHGYRVSAQAKVVGTGAPLSLLTSLRFILFWIPNMVSWPVMTAGLAGAVLFARERGRAGLFHPFLVFPVLVGGYITMLTWGGVYPAQRYWYFQSLFLLIFCGSFLKQLWPVIVASRETAVAAVLVFGPLFPGLGLLLTRPESPSPDGRWLLLAAALLALALAALLAWFERLRARPGAALLTGVAVLIGVSYPVLVGGLYPKEFAELTEEHEKQTQMIAVADFLAAQIPPDRGDRILIPSRRNEQLSWLWREREIPDAFTFREAFYLAYFKGVDFLDLHPDWIVYIPGDFQFWGPDKEFAWLKHQDQTQVRGIEIKLVMNTQTIRVFRVVYPPGHPAKAPLPPIP